MLALILFLLVGDDPVLLEIGKAKTGDVGRFPQAIDQKNPKPFYDFRVASVKETEVILEVKDYVWRATISGERVGPPEPTLRARWYIVVRGVDTSEMADGKHVGLAGKYKVVGTRKITVDKKQTTVYEFEPVTR